MIRKTFFDDELTLEEAKILIKNGADVNEINDYKRTPLFMILNRIKEIGINNTIEMIHLLVKNGANINAVDYFNENLLMVCLKRKDLIDKDKEIIIKCLISYKINTNTRDFMGFSALSKTVNMDIIRLLIRNKAVPTSVYHYKLYRDLFTKEQQHAFDSFLLLTNNDDDFHQICLACNEDIKNDVYMNIKEIEIE